VKDEERGGGDQETIFFPRENSVSSDLIGGNFVFRAGGKRSFRRFHTQGGRTPRGEGSFEGTLGLLPLSNAEGEKKRSSLSSPYGPPRWPEKGCRQTIEGKKGAVGGWNRKGGRMACPAVGGLLPSHKEGAGAYGGFAKRVAGPGMT